MKKDKTAKLSDDVLLVTNDMQVIGKIPLAAVKTNATKAAPGGQAPKGKVFDAGIVSWTLFHAFWEEQEKLLDDLNFLVDAGFRTDRSMAALEFIERELEQAKTLHKEAWQRALAECEAAGGNYVTVVSEDPPRLKGVSIQEEAVVA